MEDRIGYLRLQSVQPPLFPPGIAGVLTMVRSQKSECLRHSQPTRAARELTRRSEEAHRGAFGLPI